jgi:hypothetical protein
MGGNRITAGGSDLLHCITGEPRKDDEKIKLFQAFLSEQVYHREAQLGINFVFANCPQTLHYNYSKLS